MTQLQEFSAPARDEERSLQKSKRNGARARSLVVASFAMVAFAFTLFLTINGASGISSIVSLLAVILVAIGLFGSSAGVFMLARRRPFPLEARKGLALQGIGLASLFFAVILAATSSTLTGFLAGAVVLAESAAFALIGAALFGKVFTNTFAATRWTLLAGMALLFAGAAIIIAFNLLALTFYVSNAGALIYEDIGATVSAYGSVLGAYSFTRVLSRQRISLLSENAHSLEQ